MPYSWTSKKRIAHAESWDLKKRIALAASRALKMARWATLSRHSSYREREAALWRVYGFIALAITICVL